MLSNPHSVFPILIERLEKKFIVKNHVLGNETGGIASKHAMFKGR